MSRLPLLDDRLKELRDFVSSTAAEDARPGEVHPDNRDSALNLAHYVALRRQDIRSLQHDLARLGLSSLGRAEGHVLATIDLVRQAVTSLGELPVPEDNEVPVDLTGGDRLLAENAERLLGHARGGRRTRIMVTLPSEAATDQGLVERVITAGAEVVRINCAHDCPDDWRAMVENVRATDRRLGRRTTVTMDLAGPKLRTGAIAPGPQVLKVRPQRDLRGRVVTPRRVCLTTDGGPAEGLACSGDDTTHLPVMDGAWLAQRSVGERLEFTDARDSARSLTVLEVAEGHCLTEVNNTTYFLRGTVLTAPDATTTTVGDLPAVEQRLRLFAGDDLLVVADDEPIDPEALPKRIGCTLPEVFDDVRAGDRIFFDDGKIGGEVIGRVAEGLRVRITDAAPRGTRLGAAKGINLPDSQLRLPSLTEEDEADLAFLVEYADAISLSFVRRAEDVARLQERLADLGHPDHGIILKVETVEGFENLPDIFFQALKSPSVGVMIARGDLAVEAGYVRLAEVQEEILWLAEAAHVPVIWATQVLDNLAKTGMPSRAEVTDAAMAVRAECVMLNKGPYIDRAVDFLDDLLARMAEHHHKKRSLLRRLRAWDPVEDEDVAGEGFKGD